MPMHHGRKVHLCDCCAMKLVNDDLSSCKDYYEHTHAPCEHLNAMFVIDGDEREVTWSWVCEGCATRMNPYSNQWNAVELIDVPHSDYPHWPGYLIGCPACEDHCNCGWDVAKGHAAQCVWPGHEEE